MAGNNAYKENLLAKGVTNGMMWKENYRVGEELIDNQHQELFNRVSSFIQAVQADGPWEDRKAEVLATLEFMQHYVIIHFADEEQFQKEIGYPSLEKHTQIHEQFKAEVAEFAHKVELEGLNEQGVQEFAAKVMTWLIMHVAGEDQEIGRFIRAQGGSQ